MRYKIIVKANFNKNDIYYDENFDAYRVFVKAKPKEGEANKEVEKFLSKYFKRKAKIVGGFKSSRKIIELI